MHPKADGRLVEQAFLPVRADKNVGATVAPALVRFQQNSSALTVLTRFSVAQKGNLRGRRKISCQK